MSAPARSPRAASTARELAAIAADLGASRAELETTFVDVGDWLSQSATLLNRISTTFEALPQDLASPELTEATTRLEAVGRRAQEISASFAAEQNDIARLVAVVTGAAHPISDLRRTIKMMGIVAVNARVVAAGIGGDEHDFDVFTTDIAQLLSGATGTIQAFSSVYAQLTGEVNKAAGQRAQFELSHRDTLSSLATRLETNLDEIVRRRTASSEGSAETGRVSRQITEQIGSAVMAMQVGDSTRQRIEHIEIALGDLARLMDGAKIRDVLLDDENRPAALADVCQLESKQLASTGATYDREVAEAELALQQLASDAQTVMARSQDVYGGNGTRGQSSLTVFSTEVRRAVEVLRNCEAERGKLERVASDVQATVKILLEHVEAVREIEANMRLVSLNAAVRCAQLGPRGRALNVIARQLRELTGDTVLAAEAAMKSLGEAATLAQSFSASSSGEAAGQIAWLEREAIAAVGLLETVDQRLNDALSLLNKDGPEAIKRVAKAAARLSSRDDLGEVIADADLRLTALCGETRGPSPAESSKPVLTALRKTYTMEAERKIHDGFAGAPAKPGAKAPVDDLADMML